MKNFIKPEQFPYKSVLGWEYDSGNYPAALQEGDGHDRLRRRCARSRPRSARRGELMGIGISQLHRDRRRRARRKHFDILGIKMFDSARSASTRPARRSRASARSRRARATRRPTRRSSPRSSAFPPRDIQVEEGDTDTAPYGLGTYASRSTPTAGAAGAMAARKIRDKARKIAAHLLEVARGRPRVGGRQVPGQGRAAEVEDDPGDRLRRLHQPSAGDGGRAGGGRLLRSAEPDLPVRQLHLRRRHRPRHRRGEDPPLRRDRRLRQHHQPDDRRRPDPRRPDAWAWRRRC